MACTSKPTPSVATVASICRHTWNMFTVMLFYCNVLSLWSRLDLCDGFYFFSFGLHSGTYCVRLCTLFSAIFCCYSPSWGWEFITFCRSWRRFRLFSSKVPKQLNLQLYHNHTGYVWAIKQQWTEICTGRRRIGCLNVHHWSLSVLQLLGNTYFHINLLCIVISIGYNHGHNHTQMLWFFWLYCS